MIYLVCVKPPETLWLISLIQIYMTGIAMLEEYVNSLTSVKFTFNNKHDNMQWFDKDFLNSWI
jgi:hypothetical protein